MKEERYPLRTILDTFTTHKNSIAKKRVIYNQAPIGGIASKWIIIFFLSLPVVLYFALFNSVMFSMLGIAQAIIFYIVFLSIIMILIVTLTFVNNNKVLREIHFSWQSFFPNVDLRQLLSSGTTVYKDFLTYYSQALSENLEEEVLHQRLQENFYQMQEENKELYERMNP